VQVEAAGQPTAADRPRLRDHAMRWPRRAAQPALRTPTAHPGRPQLVRPAGHDRRQPRRHL